MEVLLIDMGALAMFLAYMALCIGAGYHTKRNDQGTGPLMSHGHPAPPNRSDLPGRRHLKAAVRQRHLRVIKRLVVCA